MVNLDPVNLAIASLSAVVVAATTGVLVYGSMTSGAHATGGREPTTALRRLGLQQGPGRHMARQWLEQQHGTVRRTCPSLAERDSSTSTPAEAASGRSRSRLPLGQWPPR